MDKDNHGKRENQIVKEHFVAKNALNDGVAHKTQVGNHKRIKIDAARIAVLRKTAREKIAKCDCNQEQNEAA